MLAGPWLERLIATRFSRLRFARACSIACIGFLAFAFVYGTFIRGRSNAVAKTRAVRELAGKIEKTFGGNPPPITFTRSVPFGVQFYLGTMRMRASNEDADAVLAGELPAFVALRIRDSIPDGLYVVVEPEPDWPRQWCVVSNQPLSDTPFYNNALIHEGAFRVELRNANWIEGNHDTIMVSPLDVDSSISIKNLGVAPRDWTINFRSFLTGDEHYKTITVATSDTVTLALE